MLKRLKAVTKLIIWKLNGQPDPPPHLIKEKTVKEYAKKYNLHTLIETGTFEGDMISAVKKRFKTIHSIELDHTLYEKSAKRFSEYSDIHLHCGDSGVVLPQILNDIGEPCLFWLDAHYSGGITAKGETETPIMKELKIIFDHPLFEKHLILIDDARCFNGTGDYPAIDRVKEYVLKRSGKCGFTVFQDIIRICGQAPE